MSGAPVPIAAREGGRAPRAAAQDHAGLLLRAEPAAAPPLRALLARAHAAGHQRHRAHARLPGTGWVRGSLYL